MRRVDQTLGSAALLQLRRHVDGSWKVNGEISVDYVGCKAIGRINAIEAFEKKIKTKVMICAKNFKRFRTRCQGDS